MAQELFDDFVESISESLEATEYIPLEVINEEALDESEQRLVDGVNVLARLRGPSFIVDGKSDNKRYYSRKLWETALKKTKPVMDSGQMFGTVGHKQPIDDDAIREGKITHRVHRLWIDESRKVGMGEYLIINTDSGRNLNALLRSGVKIAVSSRAFGDFKGKTSDGYDIVDEDKYDFLTFDFVKTPGISIAYPTLVESKEESETLPDEGLPTESDQSVEELEQSDLDTSESGKLKNEDLTIQHEVINMSENSNPVNDSSELLKKVYEEKAELMAQVKDVAGENDEFRARIAILEDHLNTIKSNLAKYENLGTIEEITTALTKMEHLNESKDEAQLALEAYRSLGTVDDINEAKEYIVSLTEQLASYKNLGDVETVREMVEGYKSHKSYLEDLGSFEQISEAFDKSTERLNEYRELGTPEEISKVFGIVESYSELGTPEEISIAFDSFSEHLKEQKAKQLAESVKEFTDKYSVSESLAEELIKAHGLQKASQIAEGFKPVGKVASRYVVSEDRPNKPLTETSVGLEKTRLEKLSESFSR